jgi:hypothetical protein
VVLGYHSIGERTGAMESKTKQSPESVVREIKRQTRLKFNSGKKIHIILEGLRGRTVLPISVGRRGLLSELDLLKKEEEVYYGQNR